MGGFLLAWLRWIGIVAGPIVMAVGYWQEAQGVAQLGIPWLAYQGIGMAIFVVAGFGVMVGANRREGELKDIVAKLQDTLFHGLYPDRASLEFEGVPTDKPTRCNVSVALKFQSAVDVPLKYSMDEYEITLSGIGVKGTQLKGDVLVAARSEAIVKIPTLSNVPITNPLVGSLRYRIRYGPARGDYLFESARELAMVITPRPVESKVDFTVKSSVDAPITLRSQKKLSDPLRTRGS